MRNDVLSLAKDVYMNESRSFICPFCKDSWEGQGRPISWRPNRSFSITRMAEGVVYNCYRSSCNGKGFIPLFEAVKDDKKRAFEPKVYPYATEYLGKEKVRDELNLTDNELSKQEILYNEARNTVVFPIYDYRGYKIGVVDRSYSGRKPKAISYFEHEAPKMHFPIGIEIQDTVVMVEDIISSIVGSRIVPHLALLGTSLSSGDAVHLRKLGVKHLRFALDEDASDKAVNLCRRYTLLFNTVEPIFLEKDIKNMSLEELKTYEERVWKSIS